MDTKQDNGGRRTYRRAVSVKLAPDLLEDLERDADRHGLALAEVLPSVSGRVFPLYATV